MPGLISTTCLEKEKFVLWGAPGKVGALDMLSNSFLSQWEGGCWGVSPWSYGTLPDIGVLARGCLALLYWLQCVLFPICPRCRSLSTSFWISHKGNFSVKCWIRVFVDGRRVQSCFFCHLAVIFQELTSSWAGLIHHTEFSEILKETMQCARCPEKVLARLWKSGILLPMYITPRAVDTWRKPVCKPITWEMLGKGWVRQAHWWSPNYATFYYTLVGESDLQKCLYFPKGGDSGTLEPAHTNSPELIVWIFSRLHFSVTAHWWLEISCDGSTTPWKVRNSKY